MFHHVTFIGPSACDQLARIKRNTAEKTQKELFFQHEIKYLNFFFIMFRVHTILAPFICKIILCF